MYMWRIKITSWKFILDFYDSFYYKPDDLNPDKFILSLLAAKNLNSITSLKLRCQESLFEDPGTIQHMLFWVSGRYHHYLVCDYISIQNLLSLYTFSNIQNLVAAFLKQGYTWSHLGPTGLNCVIVSPWNISLHICVFRGGNTTSIWI